MKLSERIRAGSEAAPWVVEEVKALEAEVARLRHEVHPSDAERIRAVLEKHLRVEVAAEKDFDSYGGSSTDVHVKLVWEDAGTEVTLSEGWGTVMHERSRDV